MRCGATAGTGGGDAGSRCDGTAPSGVVVIVSSSVLCGTSMPDMCASWRGDGTGVSRVDGRRREIRRGRLLRQDDLRSLALVAVDQRERRDRAEAGQDGGDDRRVLQAGDERGCVTASQRSG